jgi:sulfate permease, SulP family
VDAVAFLSTEVAVLAVNAVPAVAIGCSLYVLRAIWVRLVRPAQIPDLPEMEGGRTYS